VVATGFMIFRLFDPEDGGNLLPRNFFWLSVDYTELQLIIQNPL
jgi:hypothetical protein